MSNLNLKSITENLLDTFVHAGEITKQASLRGVKITIKDDKSPVTNADLAVNDLLKYKIKNLTPKIPIVSEENVNLSSVNLGKNCLCK